MPKLKKQPKLTAKNSEGVPIIKIIETRELPNGELEVTFDYDKRWTDLVKKDLGKKRVTKKDIEKHFLDLLRKGLEKLDGYDIEKTG